METFYTKDQLLNFKKDDFQKKVLGKRFTFFTQTKSFIGTPTNVLAAQPDNLFDEIEFLTEEGGNETLLIPDIKRLTLIE